MEKNKNSKADACCTSHRSEILGIILIAVATVLTLLTFDGTAILGMFIVGLVFCCHKHWGCRRCHCGCENCTTDMHCSTTTIAHKKTPVVAKKTTTKITTKK